jgi:hypothetical protein
LGKEKMKEICVLCGKETPYETTRDINLRFGYVEGAGQLCANCKKKIK